MRLGNHSHCRQVGGPVGGPAVRALVSVLVSPRPGPFTAGRWPPVRAGHVRSRPVVNGGAQSSKACEGASLPWVQIPPPPPLTCKNTGPDSRLAAASRSRGLIWWSQLRALSAPPTGISRGCWTWSRTPGRPWTEARTPPGRAPARSRQAGTVRDRSNSRQLADRITLSDLGVLENARRPPLFASLSAGRWSQWHTQNWLFGQLTSSFSCQWSAGGSPVVTGATGGEDGPKGQPGALMGHD
jgi:hypothetical protein